MTIGTSGRPVPGDPDCALHDPLEEYRLLGKFQEMLLCSREDEQILDDVVEAGGLGADVARDLLAAADPRRVSPGEDAAARVDRRDRRSELVRQDREEGPSLGTILAGCGHISQDDDLPAPFGRFGVGGDPLHGKRPQLEPAIRHGRAAEGSAVRLASRPRQLFESGQEVSGVLNGPAGEQPICGRVDDPDLISRITDEDRFGHRVDDGTQLRRWARTPPRRARQRSARRLGRPGDADRRRAFVLASGAVSFPRPVLSIGRGGCDPNRGAGGPLGRIAAPWLTGRTARGACNARVIPIAAPLRPRHPLPRRTGGGTGNRRRTTILEDRNERDHDAQGRSRQGQGAARELGKTTERGVKTRQELFTTIKAELTVHEIIEEEIFYPALKEHPKAKDIVLEAYEEHNVVDTIMGEM